MIPVWWLLQHVSDVPGGDAWLSAAEREVLAQLWAPKRIRDWRLGRWTGKQALARAGVARCSDPDTLASVSIRARESGSPCVFLDEREAECVISLSHSGEYGACAVALGRAALGCDVETIGRRGEEFVLDWFTERERRAVAAAATDEARSVAVTRVWSAKESALKALGVGLRLDTREVEVEVTGPGEDTEPWSPLVVHAPGRSLHGWWHVRGGLVVTIVADPPPAVPQALDSVRP